MHPCGPCRWSSQKGAKIVSFISAGHFLVQLIVVCAAGHTMRKLPGLSSNDGYYGLIVFTVLLLLMSILLFFGVQRSSVCMILPWIVTTSIADVGYFAMLIVCFFLSLTDSTNSSLYLGVFFGATFVFGIVTYLLWVVIYFLVEILPQPSIDPDVLLRKAEENKFSEYGKESDIAGSDSDTDIDV